jgi:ureidoglycolate hydrolase
MAIPILACTRYQDVREASHSQEGGIPPILLELRAVAASEPLSVEFIERHPWNGEPAGPRCWRPERSTKGDRRREAQR